MHNNAAVSCFPFNATQYLLLGLVGLVSHKLLGSPIVTHNSCIQISVLCPMLKRATLGLSLNKIGTISSLHNVFRCRVYYLLLDSLATGARNGITKASRPTGLDL